MNLRELEQNIEYAREHGANDETELFIELNILGQRIRKSTRLLSIMTSGLVIDTPAVELK